jgi:GNAT superfamily N-acetyltransferase
LNKLVVGEREVIPPGAESGLFKTDSTRYKPWLPDRFDPAPLRKHPVAVYPTHMARRISTQRSCFTVHGADPEGIERIADETDGAHLSQVVIPRSSVKKIQDELAIAGIDEVTIFPDLDGLGRALNRTLQQESGQAKIEYKKVAVPREVDRLCEFDRRIFHQFPSDLFSAEEWETYESYWMLVDGTAVGCSAFLRDVDFDETPKPDSLFIVTTGVLPEFRRRGLGRAQKKWQLQFGRDEGFHCMVTCSRRSNSAIISLNLDLGFTIRAMSQDNYYSDPDEPAVIMDLPLTG